MAPILVSGATALNIKINQVNLRLLLAFSAAYLFALSIIHLLPEAFELGNVKQMGLFIVLGFCLQLLIDTFSTGIEHGHVHLHNQDCTTRLPTGIFIGLMLHSFLEGLPVYSVGPGQTAAINQQLILGLALHNIPITIAFVSLLKEHESKAGKKWLMLLLFSVMTPLGYLSSFVLQSYGLRDYKFFSGLTFALVIGIFLHISTAILFETSEHHKYNRTKVVMMTLGILLAYLIS
jgi:zinc transporter ZupT